MKWASWAIVFMALWLIASPWALHYRDRIASADDVIVGVAGQLLRLLTVRSDKRRCAC
jgi:hypothetical protein